MNTLTKSDDEILNLISDNFKNNQNYVLGDSKKNKLFILVSIYRPDKNEELIVFDKKLQKIDVEKIYNYSIYNYFLIYFISYLFFLWFAFWIIVWINTILIFEFIISVLTSLLIFLILLDFFNIFLKKIINNLYKLNHKYIFYRNSNDVIIYKKY